MSSCPPYPGVGEVALCYVALVPHVHVHVHVHHVHHGGLALPRQPKGEPRIRNLCENSTVARPPNPTFYPPTKTPTCLPIAADKLARSALIVLFPFVTESKALGGGWTP